MAVATAKHFNNLIGRGVGFLKWLNQKFLQRQAKGDLFLGYLLQFIN